MILKNDPIQIRLLNDLIQFATFLLHLFFEVLFKTKEELIIKGQPGFNLMTRIGSIQLLNGLDWITYYQANKSSSDETSVVDRPI